jgi:hypothetical protein
VIEVLRDFVVDDGNPEWRNRRNHPNCTCNKLRLENFSIDETPISSLQV